MFICNFKLLNRFLHRNQLYVKSVIQIQKSSFAITSTSVTDNIQKGQEENIEFQGKWPKDEQKKFLGDMIIITNFLNEFEESSLLKELEPYLKRMRYEFDHWDDAIHGYRETERKHWYPDNKTIIQRIREVAFQGEILPYVHVLDLAENGVIKPHVDSVRYCGSTIAGFSLLTHSVMRLVRVDEKKYQQNTNEDYRSQPDIQDENFLNNTFFANVFLPRRSLYIMRDTARYNFTHEILGNKKSNFKGNEIYKGRRISVICRNEPQKKA